MYVLISLHGYTCRAFFGIGQSNRNNIMEALTDGAIGNNFTIAHYIMTFPEIYLSYKYAARSYFWTGTFLLRISAYNINSRYISYDIKMKTGVNLFFRDLQNNKG
jgi:hypothetical protein